MSSLAVLSPSVTGKSAQPVPSLGKGPCNGTRGGGETGGMRSSRAGMEEKNAQDLLGREKPYVEFFSLEKAGGGGKGSGFFAQLDLRRNALWEGSSMQTRNAASFQCSAALQVLQLGRAAKGQRPLQGGALLSPCPWLWPSTTGFSLRRLWAGRGSRERWFSCRVMKALEVWRL